MIIKNTIWKFDNDIDTDQIIPTQYLTLPSLKDMSSHTLEPQNPHFASNYKAGEIIVGGKNFGCGSSREQAPLVLKELGVKIIIAQSFARIFFRNCINLGILLIEIPDTSNFKTGELIQIDLENANISTSSSKYSFVPLSDFLTNILNKNGLVGYLQSSK